MQVVLTLFSQGYFGVPYVSPINNLQKSWKEAEKLRSAKLKTELSNSQKVTTIPQKNKAYNNLKKEHDTPYRTIHVSGLTENLYDLRIKDQMDIFVVFIHTKNAKILQALG